MHGTIPPLPKYVSCRGTPSITGTTYFYLVITALIGRCKFGTVCTDRIILGTVLELHVLQFHDTLFPFMFGLFFPSEVFLYEEVVRCVTRVPFFLSL
jgi:hypothetical protein